MTRPTPPKGAAPPRNEIIEGDCIEALRALNPDSLSPREALEQLYELRKKLS